MRYAGRNSIPVEATYDFLYVTFLGVTLASSAHILGINALLLKILWVFFGVLVLAIRWTILGQVIESIADFVTIIWRSIEGVGAILVAIVKLFVAILITLFRIVENIIRSLIEWFIEHPIDWLRKAGYAVIYNIHSVVERLDNATYKLLSIIYEDSDLAGRRIRTNLLLRSRIVNPELDSISETLWSKIRGNVICSYESHNWHAPSDFLRICFHCGEVVCTLHSRSLIISKDMLNNKGGAVSQWYKEFSTYGDDFIIQQFGRLIKRPSTVVSKNVETTVFFCKSHSRDDLATYKAFFPLSGREELLRITQRLHEQSKFLKELLSELWSRMEKLISLIRDWMESIKRPKKSSNHE